ncbi:hypothetical protein ApDm4_2640 [Acetobacter pomorum]|nr:hypothetical protein ApDm4_2640 [Acetobacter pomorum]
MAESPDLNKHRCHTRTGFYQVQLVSLVTLREVFVTLLSYLGMGGGCCPCLCFKYNAGLGLSVAWLRKKHLAGLQWANSHA